MKPRRTKIVATLGPATNDAAVMTGILKAGVDVVRLNFSHGAAQDHIANTELVRKTAKELGREVGVLVDLQGPKIRIARFENGKVTLNVGDEFVLDAALGADEGTQATVGIDYKDLPKDVRANDVLLLDDGRIALTVKSVSSKRIVTIVADGGVLSNNKGINRQGGGLSAQALTEKDKEDIVTAAQIGADYVAISFVRSQEDIALARKLLKEAGSDAGIISKIERVEALENLDGIIKASDAVMVARGDLGVEIGDAALPRVQKHIIQRARDLNRAVIVATQMMESMIENSLPTRAEVFDVANAVIDGTDAVMLSAETAAGKYPVKTVEAMSRLCIGAEKEPSTQISKHRLECHFEQVDEAVAMATMYTANHLDVRGIIALTESGATTLWMSRIRSGIPIYGLSRHEATRRRMTLYRGVYPIAFDCGLYERMDINKNAIQLLQDKEIVKTGDLVILTKGNTLDVSGGTNSMRIIAVGDAL